MSSPTRDSGRLGTPFVRWTLLTAAAGVLAGGTLGIHLASDAVPRWLTVAIVAQVAGGILVPAAVFAWRRQRIGGLALVGGLAFAVVLRVVTMAADPLLSDDAARYHWDGKCLAHGLNPYLHPPADPKVSDLRRDALDAHINHPEYRTCYPPLAQLVFAAAYRLTPGRLLGFQLFCLAAEVATWLLLWRLLARRGRSAIAVLLTAWAPLVVFQGYLPGHVDTLTQPFVVGMILFSESGWAVASGLVLALATLIKPLPFWYAPALARSLGWGAWRMAAAFATLLVASYLPFAGAGWRIFESTWAMATRWSHNGSLAVLLESVLPLSWAHAVCGAVLLLLLVMGVRHGRDLLARMLLAQIAFVVCTPTLFPWYLVGLLPLLALRSVPSLLALVALLPLADEVVSGYRLDGVWEPAWWPTLVIYVPFFLLLARDLRRGGPLVAGKTP